MARADERGKREESSKPKPSSTPKSSMASVASKVGSAAKPAASKPPSRVTPPASKSATPKNAVSSASKVGKAVADISHIYGTDKGGGSSPTKRVVQTTPVAGPVSRPDGGLNSDKFYQRQAANNGVAPFEGVVDWGGIYDYLQAPANRRMAREAPVEITIPGKGAPSGFDKVSDQPLSFGNMLDFVGTPEVSSDYRKPMVTPKGTTYYPPDGDYGYDAETGEYVQKQPGRAYASNPLTAQERQALAMIGGMENPALGGIETAMTEPMPVYSEPSITETAYAGDLFETNGRVMTPDGKIVNPGGVAPTQPVDMGIDAATAEPRAWDTIVDNSGKVLEHVGGLGIVKALMPDLWNGIGSAFKGIGGVKTKAPEDMARALDDIYGEKSQRRREDRERDAQPRPFPDLNHNGIDDRKEGYTGPDTNPPVVPTTPPAPVFDLPPLRTARFPVTPPYDPGRSDEWSYFTNNHLADGGLVHAYAEGGEVGGAFDPGDPKVQLIEATEDVLEKIKGGAKPDEQDAEILKAFVAQFGDAALKSLNDNVGEGLSMKGAGKGRQIKGPGGPKDDAVPAVIVEEGSVVSPAKLSNGEFVFPVEAVEGAGGPEALQELADRLSKRSAA